MIQIISTKKYLIIIKELEMALLCQNDAFISPDDALTLLSQITENLHLQGHVEIF